MAMDESRVQDPHERNGRSLCAICSHEAHGKEAVWCELTGSYLCSSCCHGVTVFNPGLLVEAMSRTRESLSPTEMASVCSMCTKRRTAGPDMRDPETNTLPS